MKKIKQACFFGLLLFFLFPPAWLHAQYNASQNSIWAMPEYSGLDFNNGGPVVIATELHSANAQTGGKACASVCDSSGTLLFYTNGYQVWDATGNIMPHGHNLNNNPNAVSASQGALIVPAPGASGIYYLLSTSTGGSALFSNMVDMSLNGGLGDIDTAAPYNGWATNYGVFEKLIAVPGCNNNFWILTRGVYDIYALEITASGLDTVPVISSGSPIGTPTCAWQIDPARTRIVECGQNRVYLYDFDANTGMLSPQQCLDSNIFSSNYSAAFSPEGNKVYVSYANGGAIYQFDLNAANPASSKTLVGNGTGGDLKLGPDGKIYFASAIGYLFSPTNGGAKYMGRINNPGNAAATCGFQDSVTSLSFPDTARLQLGLPNLVWMPMPGGTSSGQVVLDTTICDYTNALLQAPANIPYDYYWDDNSTDSIRHISQAGTYWIRYTDAFCNTFTDTFKVSGVGLPPVDITQNGPTLSTTVTYNSYQWYQGGALLPMATSPTLNITATGWYSVKVSDGLVCTDSAGYEVTDITATGELSREAEKISLSPNPFTNGITLFVPAGASENYRVQIMDVSGRRIRNLSGKLSEINRQLAKNNVQPGIYLLRVQSNRISQTFKMVKE